MNELIKLIIQIARASKHGSTILCMITFIELSFL